MVVHIFNSSTQEAEKGRSLEFKANLVYRASFRTARATQKSPVLKKNQKVLIGNNKTNKQNPVRVGKHLSTTRFLEFSMCIKTKIQARCRMPLISALRNRKSRISGPDTVNIRSNTIQIHSQKTKKKKKKTQINK